LAKGGQVGWFFQVRPYQKNNLHFNRDGNYVASTGYAQIKAKQSSSYIYHYLHLQEFVDDVIERCTGTSYPAINSKDLSKIHISCPTHPEQTKIADFLSAIDDKIKHTQTQIEKAELWKKGLLQKMFV
jgi:type I restriction enzyme S subunit